MRKSFRRLNSTGQFSEESGEGVGGELSAVEGGLFEAAERFGDLRSGDAAGFVERFAGEKFSQDGGAGESGDTALRFEAGFDDGSGIDACGEAKNVSADGIRYFDDGGCAGQIAGVARILEMVEDDSGMHRKKFTVKS